MFKAPRYIGDKPELVKVHDSVTMPTFARFRKRANFNVLAGYSGTNDTDDVAIRYAHASIEYPAGTRYL